MGHFFNNMSRLESLKEAKTLSDLAVLLGFKPNSVSYIIYKIPDDKKYEQFTIPKKNGDMREIKAPIPQLKLLQRRLADLLTACFEDIHGDHKSLSHGFRRDHSIITNANRHKNKRYVFNVDLKDFFPSINFGRVRGFFLKDHHFNLNPKVATVIAQIACHNNQLPQGSPSSPVISNLIAHLLDIRMVNLAKKGKCTYSRYADDLTFSSNKKEFPSIIAVNDYGDNWIVGELLEREINRAGFFINKNKILMQYSTSRQVATGLVVNRKVNIKREYYKKARSMCHELFKTGKFYLEKGFPESRFPSDTSDDGMVYGTLNQLEGILGFIYKVKFPHYHVDDKGKRISQTSITSLYRNFLYYKLFWALEKPLIICEGKTDIIYLKCALKSMSKDYSRFITQHSDGTYEFNIKFLNKTKNLLDVFNIADGSTGLLYILNNYKRILPKFRSEGMNHPVIILVDNDDGASKIKSRIKEELKLKIWDDTTRFYNFWKNLYIMFIPIDKKGTIEDLFDSTILNIKISGKAFNKLNNIDRTKEYGKHIFAEKVIKERWRSINFDGFRQIFDNLLLIIDHYSKIA